MLSGLQELQVNHHRAPVCPGQQPGVVLALIADTAAVVRVIGGTDCQGVVNVRVHRLRVRVPVHDCACACEGNWRSHLGRGNKRPSRVWRAHEGLPNGTDVRSGSGTILSSFALSHALSDQLEKMDIKLSQTEYECR